MRASSHSCSQPYRGGVNAYTKYYPVWAELDSEAGTLTFKYDPVNESPDPTSTLFIYSIPNDLEKINIPWSSQKDVIQKVVFDKSFKNFQPITCALWFNRCKNLTEIEGIENLNTSMVEDMSGMFEECRALAAIDLSHFNTENVTSMADMFFRCKTLEKLDLSSFNTSKVKNLDLMFYQCEKIKSLDLSNFDTQNVVYMFGVFNGCTALTSLNVSSWNTENAKDMHSLFGGCQNLTEINISHFNTGQVENMSGMFSSCDAITSLDLSFMNTENVKNMSGMFYGNKNLKDINFSSFNTSNVTNMSGMFQWCRNLNPLDLSNFDTKNVTDMSDMFSFCNLPYVDLSCLNTQNVTNMKEMFWGSQVVSLDLSDLDTRNVTDYSRILATNDNLKTLVLPSNFAPILAESNWTHASVANILETIYVPIDQYEACKNDPNAEGRTVLPYIKVAPQNEYGTICVPMGSKLEAGTFSGFDKLYSPTLNAGKVTLNEVLQITPGAAYVYQQGGKSQSTKKYAAENKPTTPVKNAITFTPDGSTLENTPTTGNIMQGTYEEGIVPVGCYVMQPDGTFTKVTDGNTPIGAYCAYLTEVSQEETIEPTYITTGIEEIALGNNKQAHIYDLTGRRISHPQKGSLYIQNGKKVIF